MSLEATDIKKDATSLELDRLRGILNGDNPIEEKVENPTTEEAKSEEKTETTDTEKKVEEAPNDESKKSETENKVEEKTEVEGGKSENKVEVDESAVMAYLKSKNIQVDSIDDLNKKISQKSKEEEVEDPTAIAVKKLEIKKWAIENKKVDPKKLDQFEEDSKLSHIELAYKVYQSERANETNPETNEVYTDEELREEFEAENFLNEEETSLIRKRKMKNISLVAQTYLYDNYKELSEIEKSFDNEQMTAKQQQTLKQNTEIAKSKLVENGMSFAIKDELGESIEVNIPITKKLIEEISLGGNEVESIDDTDSITKAIQDKYFLNNKQKVLHEVATSYHSKKLLEIKAKSVGIEQKKAEMQEVVPDELAEKYKKLVEKHTVKS